MGIHTIVHRWKVLSADAGIPTDPGDNIESRIRWHGGKGYLLIGGIDVPNVAAMSAIITWLSDNEFIDPLPSAQVLAQSIGGVGPFPSALYPFEAPEGILDVLISVTAPGRLGVSNIHIVW